MSEGGDREGELGDGRASRRRERTKAEMDIVCSMSGTTRYLSTIGEEERVSLNGRRRREGSKDRAHFTSPPNLAISAFVLSCKGEET